MATLRQLRAARVSAEAVEHALAFLRDGTPASEVSPAEWSCLRSLYVAVRALRPLTAGEEHDWRILENMRAARGAS